MFKQKIIYFLLFFFMQTTSMAELTIRITQGVGKQTPVAIVPFGVGSGLSKISENITK